MHGDLEEAERLAGGIGGVSNVRRAGADTLEIELAAGPTDDGIDAAALLGALVAPGFPWRDFREDVREGDGGLEHLFLQLTEPQPPEPVEQVG